jgi:hypothetical protein
MRGRRGIGDEYECQGLPCHRDGEDEADASRRLISWTAPLAQALPGSEAGESVPFQGVEAEIVSIEP